MYVLIQKYLALELTTNGLELTMLSEHNLHCYLNTYQGYGGLRWCVRFPGEDPPRLSFLKPSLKGESSSLNNPNLLKIKLG